MFTLTLITGQGEDTTEFTELHNAICCAQSFVEDETIQKIVLDGEWDGYHLEGIIRDKKVNWKSVKHVNKEPK